MTLREVWLSFRVPSVTPRCVEGAFPFISTTPLHQPSPVYSEAMKKQDHIRREAWEKEVSESDRISEVGMATTSKLYHCKWSVQIMKISVPIISGTLSNTKPNIAVMCDGSCIQRYPFKGPYLYPSKLSIPSIS